MAVERINGLFLGLAFLAVGGDLLRSLEGIFDLLSFDVKELGNRCWRNGLLKNVNNIESYSGVSGLSAVDSHDLGDGLVASRGVVDVGVLGRGVVFNVGRLVAANVERSLLGGERGVTVGLSEHTLALGSGNVASVS